jgi:hypothetical protein
MTIKIMTMKSEQVQTKIKFNSIPGNEIGNYIALLISIKILEACLKKKVNKKEEAQILTLTKYCGGIKKLEMLNGESISQFCKRASKYYRVMLNDVSLDNRTRTWLEARLREISELLFTELYGYKSAASGNPDAILKPFTSDPFAYLDLGKLYLKKNSLETKPVDITKVIKFDPKTISFDPLIFQKNPETNHVPINITTMARFFPVNTGFFIFFIIVYFVSLLLKNKLAKEDQKLMKQEEVSSVAGITVGLVFWLLGLVLL